VADVAPDSAHIAHAAAMPRLNALPFILNPPYPDFPGGWLAWN
jgi:hypothetical protein